MILAAIGDTPYNIVLFLHVLSIIVGFAPIFVHPILAKQMEGEAGQSALLRFMAGNAMRIYSSGVIVAGLLGFALAGMSDKVYSMSDPWLAAAFIVWVGILGAMHALIIPGEKALASGDRSAESKVNLGSGAVTVLMLVMLYLMIFKPGA